MTVSSFPVSSAPISGLDLDSEKPRLKFISDDEATQLSKSTVRIGTLVELLFDTPQRLWNGNTSLTTSDSKSWSGLGGLGSIEGLEEIRGSESQAVAFSLSGVSAEILAKATGEAADVQGKLVRIYFQLFDSSWQISGAPVPIWFGVCQTIGVNRTEMPDEAGAQRTVSLTAENLFYGRSRPKAGRYTDRDQKTRHPGDKFLEFTPQLASLIYIWPDY